MDVSGYEIAPGLDPTGLAGDDAPAEGAFPDDAEPRADAAPWLLWQFIDSAFPTGGFAHSGGLEAAWQQGEVSGVAGVEQWAAACLAQLAGGVLPLVLAAHAEPARLGELDDLQEAITVNHVANRASRLQGRSLWNALVRIFPEIQPQMPAEPVQGHFAPVFGAVAAVLGFERTITARAFVFVQIRAVFAAAVRLNIIGPMAAQSLQARMAVRCDQAVQRGLSLGLADLAQTFPLGDLWQGAQDRLYSRIFQS